MTSFMQIPGFQGDSTDPEHVGWIEIVSFKTEKRDGVSGEDKRRIARVQKRRDGASEALLTRGVVEYASITFDVADAKGSERITLQNVELWRVFTKAVGSDAHAEPGEELEFVFQTAVFEGHNPWKKAPRANSTALPQLFLSIPGIAGAATDPAHRGWIELKRIVRLTADGTSLPKFMDRGQRFPQVVRAVEAASGSLSVLKFRDAASDALQQALLANREFDVVILDHVHLGTTRRFQFENVRLTQFSRSSADEAIIRKPAERAGDEFTLIYDRYQRRPPPSGKAPTVHPVARAHAAATTERTTINLRPPKFFELALPVLTGEGGKRIHPPTDAVLRLVSNRGYDRSVPIAKGMITEDGFCSIRFDDISEKATDELFTATLVRGLEIETIFKDRRVATYVAAARKNGPYEPAFPPGPESANLSQ
ncbi:MAG: type VI secretion system tube protein Hcp [Phycisphaerales bacterium]|nr:type VI secretion system tube protein Hcp [Phycisphaerales bacterium]